MAEETSSTQQQQQGQGRGPGGSNGNGSATAAATADQPRTDVQTNGRGGDTPPGPGASNGTKKLIIGALIAAAVIIGGIWGIKYLAFARTHVSTDDAYVTGNLVNISPIISGTLSELNVQEGDTVQPGQLIARLEDSSQRAALQQAEAAYEAARTAVPQARTSLSYQEQATEAAIQRAEAALQAQQAKTAGAADQTRLAAATTTNQVAQAQAQVEAARAQAAQAQAQVVTAQAAVRAARQGITTADKGVGALQARVAAAQAEVKRTQADLARYGRLLAQEAVTQQQYDSVSSQAATAQSTLDSLNQQIAQAQSQASQARESVRQAEAQMAAAQQAARAAQQQVSVAQAGLGVAEANRIQVPVQQSNVASNTAQNAQNQADLQTAQAGRQQVALQRQRIATTIAQAAQAKAARDNAKTQLDDTYIYSPTAGEVVRKSVNVGAAISPGQTIATVTQGGFLWVTGNFKETQLTNVRVGQDAEIEVDAFPKKTFKGVVASINAATGATTSLLPPDNATGNFTKVVQRIPVRIAIVPAEGGNGREATAEDIKMLRQGMSVVATIDTHDLTPHPEKVPANYDGRGSNGYKTGSSSAPAAPASGGAPAAPAVDVQAAPATGGKESAAGATTSGSK